MAVVSPIYTMEFYVEDAKHRPSVITIYLGAIGIELPIDYLIDAAIALYGYLEPLVSGQIRRASTKIFLYQNEPETPDPDSDVESGAIFMLYAEDTDNHDILRLPAFLETLYEDDLKVDETNPDVSTFYDAVEAGFEVNDVLYRVCDSSGDTVIITSAGKDFQTVSYARQP